MLFICLCLWLLVACSNEKKAEELVQEVEKEHDEVTSVESTHKEVYSNDESEYEDVYHFEEDKVKIDFVDTDFTLYQDDENYEMVTTRDPSSIQGEEIATIKKELSQRKEFNRNPISFYKQFDDDFENHFKIEEEDDTWTLTYDPEEEVLETFYTKYTEFMLEAMNIYEGDPSISVVSNVDIKELELILTIDKETKRMVDIEFIEDASFSVDDNENALDRTLLYAYANYNEAEAIEIPSDAYDITEGIIHDDESNPLEDAFDDVFGETLEDNPEMEESAEAYLDGIIQATVFQNVDEAVNVSNGAVTEEVAEIQKSSFRDVYIDNTKANMGDVSIDDSYFEELADAFLAAIGETSYQIVDSQYDGLEEAVIVTLEVEGIDDYAVSMQTEEDMQKVIEDDDLSQEELIEENLEILADNYKVYDETLEPVEIDIFLPIIEEDEFYMNHDDYLQAFIQQ